MTHNTDQNTTDWAGLPALYLLYATCHAAGEITLAAVKPSQRGYLTHDTTEADLGHTWSDCIEIQLHYKQRRQNKGKRALRSITRRSRTEKVNVKELKLLLGHRQAVSP